MPPFYDRAALAPVPDSKPDPIITALHQGGNADGEFLLTTWSDGSRTIAWRAAAWETWSAPVELTRIES